MGSQGGEGDYREAHIPKRGLHVLHSKDHDYYGFIYLERPPAFGLSEIGGRMCLCAKKWQWAGGHWSGRFDDRGRTMRGNNTVH